MECATVIFRLHPLFLAQTTYKTRLVEGFKITRNGRRVVVNSERKGLLKQVSELFDPNVTTKTLVNEGTVFVLLALWWVRLALLSLSLILSLTSFPHACHGTGFCGF